MSIDDIKADQELVEEVSEEQLQEESEELVDEEQVVSEETEELEEKAAAKSESGHEDEEEEHEDEEEEHEEKKPVKEIQVPKTKAGVIQAALEMLKAARKEDAQKLFAKMAKVDETSEEDSIKSVDAAVKAQGKSDKDKSIKVKAKVEAVDFDEDLDTLIAEEATLSDDFRGKAGAIFEAVLTSKLAQEVDRLESEYVQNLEEEVSDIQTQLIEKVDSYLGYVVENWMKENEVAIENGLRTEIAEEFMASLHKVFKENYIEVPEGKADLVDDLSSQVTELEESLNKSTEDNIKLFQAVQNFEKQEVVREQSSGLAETEAEKLASLVEDIEFDNRENFELKVKTVKESYFKGDIQESVDEVDSLMGNDEPNVDLSDAMARYTQAITKFNK
jgi:hypothetical protein